MSPLYASYAFAYLTVLAVALGSLIWVQIAHITRARWLLPFRRQLENAAATLPLLALLFAPLLVGGHELYGWDRASEDPLLTPLARGPRGATVHAAIAFVVFCATAEILRAASRANERVASEDRTRRTRAIAAGALPAVGLCLTVFAFDFVMQLDRDFHSTIFGAIFFAACALSALGYAAFAGAIANRRHALGARDLEPHFFALGKMLFAMVFFWGYVAFSQLVLVWLADLPLEAPYYVARNEGPWRSLSFAVAAMSFAVPFALLLSRRLKRKPARVGAIGALLVFAHVLVTAWLVLPPLRPNGPFPALADVATLAIVLLAVLAFGAFRARGAAAYPRSDPDFPRALAFEDS